MNKLLYKICDYLHFRAIIVNNKPYLERSFLNGRMFLHRFVSGDGDRHLHDHPWKWCISIILWGSYIEENGAGRVIKHRKWFNIFGGNHLHRIVNAKPGTWTLFITGKRCKDWGFLNEKGEYEIMPSNPDVMSINEYPRGKNATNREPF